MLVKSIEYIQKYNKDNIAYSKLHLHHYQRSLHQFEP